MKRQPAFELIGHEGQFKLPGGKQVYEAVLYNEGSARTDRVRLAYLKTTADGFHQVNRWIDWDQPIEVLVDDDAEDD
jgi:hypothetical protein